MNPLLLPFSAAFRSGVALRHTAYNRGWFKVRRLAQPVVSVGNLTVGGTGKTPLVAYIADVLLKRGFKPSILTRGYGRSSKAPLIVVPPVVGRHGDPAEIGDEPALLARALPKLPLVVCADRLRGGQAAEECFKVDVHILDDGFQHLALARDVDVLALDATQPISDWDLLPSGRQREPLSALRRAQIVVLTRTDSVDPQPLEELVRKVHPDARIYRSRTMLVRWTNALSGQSVSADDVCSQKAAAYCGIGNPRAFFADLRRWGCKLVAENAFPDHHRYTGDEIRRLVENAWKQGAATLLTTQKDAVKFPQDWTPQMPILACEISMQILDAESFEATLLEYVKKTAKDTVGPLS